MKELIGNERTASVYIWEDWQLPMAAARPCENVPLEKSGYWEL